MKGTISCIVSHRMAKITTDATQLLFSVQKETAAF